MASLPRKRILSASCRAVFFDAGGTLFFPYPSVGEIYARVALRHGCEADPKLLEQCFRNVWLERNGLTSLASHSDEKLERSWWHSIVRKVFESFGPFRDFDGFFSELYDVFARPESWNLYPEVPEVLETLRRQGKILGIVSNWDSRLFPLCRGLGVENHFQFILASAVFGASKPSVRIFQEGLRLAGLKPEEVIHVGDSLEDDVQGARRAGVGAVWVDRHTKGAAIPESLDRQAVSIITDLRELLP